MKKCRQEATMAPPSQSAHQRRHNPPFKEWQRRMDSIAKNGLLDVNEKESDDAESEEEEQADKGPIPPAQWPVSIRDEDGNFVTVIHPGHKAKGHPDHSMQVPRFWINDPVSIHQNTLMSRELAMKIGSCINPDEHGSKVQGDDCPVSQRTIYVAIASYRDRQCHDTVASIFSRAKYPERVRVGVADQIVEGEDGLCNAPYKPCLEDPEQALCKWKSQLDVFQVDAPLSIGPVFAWHIGECLMSVLLLREMDFVLTHYEFRPIAGTKPTHRT